MFSNFDHHKFGSLPKVLDARAMRIEISVVASQLSRVVVSRAIYSLIQPY